MTVMSLVGWRLDHGSVMSWGVQGVIGDMLRGGGCGDGYGAE